MDVKFEVHGRDPQVGLDCVGLILSVYRGAGKPIDNIDVPYGRPDGKRKDRKPLMMNRLKLRFKELEHPIPAVCQDGDVLMIGKGDDNHITIVIQGCSVEMTTGGLKTFQLSRVWPFVTSVFRLDEKLV